jgi:hypothetical protein
MRQLGFVIVVSVAVVLVGGGTGSATTTSATASATLLHCGNPPGFSGGLTAHGVSCKKARAIFNNIHCTDSSCSTRHSGSWPCTLNTERRFIHHGSCHSGEKFIRFYVSE